MEEEKCFLPCFFCCSSSSLKRKGLRKMFFAAGRGLGWIWMAARGYLFGKVRRRRRRRQKSVRLL